MFLSRLWSMGNTSGTTWLFIELPETPVSTSCSRLLFDRGKMLNNVVILYKHHTFGLQVPMSKRVLWLVRNFYTADGNSSHAH